MLSIWAPDGIGEIEAGDDLTAVVADAVGDDLRDGDILLITSKIVSKAEGRRIDASDREQAITDETVRVVASREHPNGVTRIVENRLGLVMAAAGVDSSNTPDGTVLLLPTDPDVSARTLRAGLRARLGIAVGVIITDTVGRPWREGQTDIAIGAAGIRVVDDLRGQTDASGRPLTVTITAVADELAGVADLVKGKSAGRPVAVVRGMPQLLTEEDGPGARALVRSAEKDMFRLGTDEAYAAGFEAGARAKASLPAENTPHT